MHDPPSKNLLEVPVTKMSVFLDFKSGTVKCGNFKIVMKLFHPFNKKTNNIERSLYEIAKNINDNISG